MPAKKIDPGCKSLQSECWNVCIFQFELIKVQSIQSHRSPFRPLCFCCCCYLCICVFVMLYLHMEYILIHISLALARPCNNSGLSCHPISERSYCESNACEGRSEVHRYVLQYSQETINWSNINKTKHDYLRDVKGCSGYPIRKVQGNLFNFLMIYKVIQTLKERNLSSVTTWGTKRGKLFQVPKRWVRNIAIVLSIYSNRCDIFLPSISTLI